MDQFSKHIEDLGLIRDRFTYLEDQGYNFDYLYWTPWTSNKFLAPEIRAFNADGKFVKSQHISGKWSISKTPYIHILEKWSDIRLKEFSPEWSMENPKVVQKMNGVYKLVDHFINQIRDQIDFKKADRGTSNIVYVRFFY